MASLAMFSAVAPAFAPARARRAARASVAVRASGGEKQVGCRPRPPFGAAARRCVARRGCGWCYRAGARAAGLWGPQSRAAARFLSHRWVFAFFRRG